MLLRGQIEQAEDLFRTSLLEDATMPLFDLPHWMEGLAAVAAAQGDVSRAATLWGAADGLFERLGLAALEEDRQVRERFKTMWMHQLHGHKGTP